MAIGKMLKLGGLENSAPNTSQTSGRFKVAKNVVISKDNYITPRPSMQGFTGNTGHTYPVTQWTHFTSYTDFVTKTKKLLRFGWEPDSGGYKYGYLFDDNGVIPSYNYLNVPGSNYGFPYNTNFSDQSVESQGCKYILSSPNGLYSKLLRYDGFEVSQAGVNAPWFVPSPSTNWTTGTYSIKVISHFLDFQGNNVTSDTVSFRTNGIGSNFQGLATGVTPSNTPMMVGSGSGGFAYSYDGVTWDSNVRYTGAYWPSYADSGPPVCKAICQGTVSSSPLWVAIDSSTSITDYPVWISEDGVNWRRVIDASLVGKGGGWSSAVWAGNKFVAVRSSGGASAAEKVMTSVDGVVWTYRTATSTNSWQSVAYNSAGTTVRLVAVSTDGAVGTQIMTSADGITWTARTSVAANQWRSVVYGAGSLSQWMAVASTGTTLNQAMSSTDGITWTAVTVPSVQLWTSITYLNSPVLGAAQFVATGGNAIIYKTSLTSFTAATAPNTNTYVCSAAITPTGADRALVVIGTNSSVVATDKLIYAADNSSSTLISGLTTFSILSTPLKIRLNLSKNYTSVLSFLQSTDNSTEYQLNDLQKVHFYGKATYNSVSQEYDLTTPTVTNEWNINNAGTWGNLYVIRVTNFIKNNTRYTAIAYKFNSAGTKFNKDIKLFNSVTNSWEDIDGSTVSESSGLFSASRIHYTVWSSTSPTGVFYYRGLAVGGYLDSSVFDSQETIFDINIGTVTIENPAQKATLLPFSISGTLNDWYDITSVKQNFNDLVYNYGLSSTNFVDQFVAMTIYQDSIVLATQDILYFSDYTLGGSFEMNSGLASIKVGDSDYGRITAICGTKDFLIVSREKKVYMVAGTLGTANLRVQEIPGISIGAYSNSCLQEVDGNVILMSSVGCWWINAANSKKLSEQIELNFKTFLKRYITQQPSVAADSVIFDMNQYPANAYYEPTSGKYITCAYDSYRNLLVFTDNSTSKCGDSLVLHLGNEEWTNWESYDTDGFQTTAMTFINGVMHVGTLDTINNLARTSSEDTSTSVYTYDYTSRSAPKLITTWMTAGEPSLEKQVLQLKLFGYIWSDLSIKHYQNWDLTTPITNTTYTSPGSTSPNNYIMFHKQRLNSSKAMAMAIEIELKSSGKSFWIEGMEVEFEAIQTGMKR